MKKSENNRIFPGVVKAHREAVLSFQVTGKISEFNFLEGQKVKAGDILARLDEKDFQFIVDGLVARMKDVSLDLERARDLYAKNVVPKSSLDKAQTAFDILKADLDRGKKALSDTVLLAPYDGVITRRYAELYQDIEKNKPVLLIQDVSKIDIEIAVHEKLMANHKEGENYKMYARFDSVSDQEYLLSVKEYQLEADPSTLTYSVTLTMDNPLEHTILPGMTTRVRISFPDFTESGSWIPSSCLVAIAKEDFFVFLFSNGVVNQKKVKVGEIRKDMVQILEGVNQGDQVVSAGVSFLTDGLKVKEYQKVLK